MSHFYVVLISIEIQLLCVQAVRKTACYVRICRDNYFNGLSAFNNNGKSIFIHFSQLNLQLLAVN